MGSRRLCVSGSYARLVAAACLGANLPLGPVDACAQDQQQVLVIYGTRRDASIAVLGDARLPQLIQEGLGQRVDYYSEHLEAARLGDTTYHAALADFLESKYRDNQFDVVIATHELTLQFAAAYRDRLFAGVPIVYFSNSGYVDRPPNSTGIVHTPDFAPTVRLATVLQPDLEHLFVITGADARDRVYEAHVRAQLRPFETDLAVHYWSGLTTDDVQQRLRGVPAGSAVYYILVNRDGAGQPFHPVEYLEKIRPFAAAPVYSWVDSAMGHGIVGGSLKSQEGQTEAVSEVAIRVLRGEPADGIPPATRYLNVAQVDWRELRRWGIDRSRVPAGTIVRFEEPSAWDRYRWHVLGALALLLAQSALISGLLVNRRRLRLAEEQARRSQGQLRRSYDRIRSLGSRLLHAQETERAHIARELHDDISQQLALLSIDLRMSGRAGAAAGQPLERLDSVARSVHDLSHRLYPAKLRLIGLRAALHGLQAEFSRSRIDVTIQCEAIPSSLPPDVTLCVYRVVQEALQNVVKHSRARHVRAKLTGSGERLTLTIVDDGVGFDLHAVSGRGLGLLSMQERIEVLGGALQIRSAPGSGTRIDVQVPVRSQADEAAAAV